MQVAAQQMLILQQKQFRGPIVFELTEIRALSKYTFDEGVIYVLAATTFLEMATYGVCKVTIEIQVCCTKKPDGVSATENVFVFPDYVTLIWSRTGIVSVKQRNWTYYACALSCHVTVFFLFPQSVTSTLNGNWNDLF